VILTPAGIRRGGELVGFSPHEADYFTAELLKHAPAGCWVPEIVLNGGCGWGDGRHGELMYVEQAALQALTLGYAESNCDTHGRVGYRVTPAGGAAGADQEWDGTFPEPAPDALEAYHDGLNGGLTRLQALPALAREIGEVPLPMATWAALAPAEHN